MDITQNVVDLTVCEFVIEILINALGNLYMYNVYNYIKYFTNYMWQ